MPECILKTDHLELHVCTLPPLGVNSYLLFFRETLLVIDPGQGILQQLQALKKGPRKYKGVLLTHTHMDHIQGLEELEGFETGLLAQARPGLSQPAFNLSQFTSHPFSVRPGSFLEIRDGKNHFGEQDFTVYHLPGHSPGDAVYDFGRVLFTGDLLFSQTIGRTDLPGSNPNQMRTSLQKMRAILESKPGNTLVCPGHMEVASAQHVLDSNPFLR
ncbi:MAG TPA: MBL fold metallo-hydrolase [Thermotogota bacterium]|nr:MBL fold metallo-hydrolase [Thermotogota bacterium]HRW93567.1 MBL fold metallo-hydrolase [Thermotogota bacterium]